MIMNTAFFKLLQAMLLLLFHLQLQLLVFHSWSTVGAEVICIERERQALLDLKAGLVDDTGLLSSWGTEKEKRDCCQWERVRCSNQTGHVQMLYLQGEDPSDYEYAYEGAFFRGKISSSLLELKDLRYLNLSRNYFEFSYFPEFFGSLHNLRYLDVSYSRFYGKIPYQLGSLSHLRHLDLSMNSFDGAIPSQLGNLSKLQYLDVTYNNLIGAIPFQLGNLSNLQKLYLGFNSALEIHQENSVDAQWLSNISSLTVLDLSWVFNLNNSHDWLQNICKLQNLEELFLADCQLSDHDLLFLEPSKSNLSFSLTILDLSANTLQTKFLKSLGNICSLSTLILEEVNLTEDFSVILHNLSGCARYTLQELILEYNQITGLLSDVSKFPFLKSLDVSKNQLNGIAEGGIPETCSLNSLYLFNNRFSAELPLIIQNLFGCRSTLKELNLGGNQITGGLPDLSKFSSLKKLYLSYNQLNGTLGNVRLPPQLEIFEVSSNSIEGGIPESFGKICSLLSLDLSNNTLSNDFPTIIHNLFGCARSLQYLDLSTNQIIGTMPDISKFSSLVFLDLSVNQLNGEIPKNVRFPSQLVALKIASNSKLKGVITDSHFSNMSELKLLNLSLSSLTLTFSPSWVPPFQLDQIYLSSCTKLGPEFPKWLQSQKNLIELDISNSKISGMVPEWFWSLSPRLISLDISNNNLTGTIPNSSISFTSYPHISLASNQFEGSIPPFLKRATSLDLSRNKFSSFGMFSCADSSSESLGVLDLSNNHLSGQLPNCEWNNLKSLAYLDISNNNLSGEVSRSLGSLVELKVLALRNNKLSGDLPLSLKNFTKLVMLDVGENRLSGEIPSWIGNAFTELRMLSLRINLFTGSIPLNICHLTSLQFLDISLNNLTGKIPKCLKDFTAMSQKEKYVEDITIYHYAFDIIQGSGSFLDFDFNAQLMWKGVVQMFKNTAFRLMSIDLSSNQLIGRIPTEIINLIELISLNLSRNNLTGTIPSEIGRLKSLEFLDLSRNHFYGEIPSTLAQIDRLTMLDLSHNQLSGKIPTSTQLQSFDASSYEENLALCGKPLEKDCPEEEAAHKSPKVEENEHSIFSRPFYISMALGFITGFWGIFGSILVNRSWRYAYFRFLDNLAYASYKIIAKCCWWIDG